MKIVVVSDNHGDYEILKEIEDAHQDADFFLHLGDSELPPYMLGRFISVQGNRDINNLYPSDRTIKTPYGKIYMEHGLKLGYVGPNLCYEVDALIYLFGHTHCHELLKLDDGHYLANPGSLTRPRDGTNGTYLIITLEEDKEPDFKFIYL